MTQETKLGLVIGGAFILCFSLILTHADDGQAVDSELGNLALTSQTPPGLNERAAGRISLEDFLAPGRNARRRGELKDGRPTQNSTRTASHTIPDGPGTQAGSFNLPSGQTADAPTSPVAESDTRQSPPPQPPPPLSTVADAIKRRPRLVGGRPEDMIPATAARKRERPARDRPRDARDARRAQQHTIAGGSGASQDVQTVLEAIAAQHKSEVTDDADTSSKKERSPNTARPRDVQVYAVGEGDTLSKIAKKFYGSASRKHVMRIYDANRRVLKDVNSVRAGQELHIPNVKSKAHPQKPKPNKPDLRWYKVQPKDKYTTIAKAELGSARRWKEIHNLNKGTFPNPDRIRAGILIRLPSK